MFPVTNCIYFKSHSNNKTKPNHADLSNYLLIYWSGGFNSVTPPELASYLVMLTLGFSLRTITISPWYETCGIWFYFVLAVPKHRTTPIFLLWAGLPVFVHGFANQAPVPLLWRHLNTSCFSPSVVAWTRPALSLCGVKYQANIRAASPCIHQTDSSTRWHTTISAVVSGRNPPPPRVSGNMTVLFSVTKDSGECGLEYDSDYLSISEVLAEQELQMESTEQEPHTYALLFYY